MVFQCEIPIVINENHMAISFASHSRSNRVIRAPRLIAKMQKITKVVGGQKDDPADVAKLGFEAMIKGEGDVVSGGKTRFNRLWRL